MNKVDSTESIFVSPASATAYGIGVGLSGQTGRNRGRSEVSRNHFQSAHSSDDKGPSNKSLSLEYAIVFVIRVQNKNTHPLVKSLSDKE